MDNRDINVTKTKEKTPTKREWKKRKDKSFRKRDSPRSTHVLGLAVPLLDFVLGFFFVGMGHEHQLP